MGDSTNPYYVQPVSPIPSMETWTNQRLKALEERLTPKDPATGLPLERKVKGGVVIYPGTAAARFIPDNIKPFSVLGAGNNQGDPSKLDYAGGQTSVRPPGSAWGKADAIEGYAKEYIRRRDPNSGELPFTEKDIHGVHQNKALDSVLGLFGQGNYITLGNIENRVRSIDKARLEQSPTGKALVNARIPLRDPETGELTGKYREVSIGDTDDLAVQLLKKKAANELEMKSIRLARQKALAESEGVVNREVNRLMELLPEQYANMQKTHYTQSRQLRQDRDAKAQYLNELRRDKEIRQEQIEAAKRKEENEMLKHRELMELDRERYEDNKRERRKDRNFNAVGQGIESLMLLFGGL